MDDKAKVTELLQPYLANERLYIVDCQIAGRQGGRIKVTILLDSDEGITIDECAEISRKLGAQMDEMNFFGESPFVLEVSSPGVDFPLKFRRQYVRNIGRTLVVTLADGKTQKGKLISVADDHIVLAIEPEKKSKSKKKKEADLIAEVTPVGPTPISFEQIKKANVEISFK
ncbi:ribosome maturation factor RimP [Spirosoma panaciterrae]|uniref:ribosome maturation factor RimP n=1 Tax=Spirosoma panaciterrae TaxID=496058 RepID=UPI0003692B30|nr:ribosome maturation factor [Spirosoma panaciterrae]